MNKLFKILFYSLIFIINFLVVAVDTDKDTRIQIIKNFAAYRALISNKVSTEVICSKTEKKLSWLKSFKVPFISIKSYIKQFENDTPYVPSRALKISLKSGLYFIWANESGIVCASDPNDPEKIASWKSEILYSLSNLKAKNLSLILSINKQNKIFLNRINNINSGAFF